MQTITDLDTQLAQLQPTLHPGRYAFVVLPPGLTVDASVIVATIREAEGLSAIVPEQTALALGLAPAFVASWITLTVHSDLASVGLTAACSQALAAAGISCNLIAGVHHDHLFVPAERAAQAMARLESLSRAAKASNTPRTATRADIAGMQRVRLAVRENTLSDPSRITEADYIAAQEILGHSWVIEQEGLIVGFATAYHSGNVWALFVHPEHEGRGHGRALHATLTAWAWAQGLTRLTLSTDPGTRAERFYLAQGWQPCGYTADGERRFELPAPTP